MVLAEEFLRALRAAACSIPNFQRPQRRGCFHILLETLAGQPLLLCVTWVTGHPSRQCMPCSIASSDHVCDWSATCLLDSDAPRNRFFQHPPPPSSPRDWVAPAVLSSTQQTRLETHHTSPFPSRPTPTTTGRSRASVRRSKNISRKVRGELLLLHSPRHTRDQTTTGITPEKTLLRVVPIGGSAAGVRYSYRKQTGDRPKVGVTRLLPALKVRSLTLVVEQVVGGVSGGGWLRLIGFSRAWLLVSSAHVPVWVCIHRGALNL